MEKFLLVGFRKFTSKNGVRYCVVDVLSDYREHELKNGCFGQRASELFLPEHCTDVISSSDIGKSLQVDYDVVGNKAYISNVSVVGK